MKKKTKSCTMEPSRTKAPCHLRRTYHDTSKHLRVHRRSRRRAPLPRRGSLSPERRKRRRRGRRVTPDRSPTVPPCSKGLVLLAVPVGTAAAILPHHQYPDPVGTRQRPDLGNPRGGAVIHEPHDDPVLLGQVPDLALGDRVHGRAAVLLREIFFGGSPRAEHAAGAAAASSPLRLHSRVDLR